MGLKIEQARIPKQQPIPHLPHPAKDSPAGLNRRIVSVRSLMEAYDLKVENNKLRWWPVLRKVHMLEVLAGLEIRNLEDMIRALGVKGARINGIYDTGPEIMVVYVVPPYPVVNDPALTKEK
jgi:hypothetical protein